MNRKTVLSVLLLVLALFACACTQTPVGPAPTEAVEATREPETIIIIATEEPAALETPAATVEPADPTPSPEPEDQRALFLVSIEGTPLRSQPDVSADTVARLSAGARLRCEEDRGEFMLVELENGTKGWVDAWFIEAADSELESERDSARLLALRSRESFIPIEGEPVYHCTAASGLNCRAEPVENGKKLFIILQGTQVKVYGRDGNFYLVRLPNKKLCYCYQDYLSHQQTYAVYPGAVDLRAFLPGAEFDLLFASSNNITGHAMYPAIPLLEEETAYKLLEAYQIFREDGYTIKIYDAYRPRSAQIELFSIVQDANYIADPNRGGSWHQRGWAVDMSLINLATGEELKMPTPMHTFSKEANRMSRDQWSEEVRRNVDYMTEVMTSVGFDIIATEWWHFEYLHASAQLDPDIDLSSLPAYAASGYATPY